MVVGLLRGSNKETLHVGCSGDVSIKAWFTQVIMPDFSTVEARVRLGSIEDASGKTSPVPRLKEVTRSMRKINSQVNSEPSSSAADGYVLMEGQGTEGAGAACAPVARTVWQRYFSKLEPGGIRTTTIALVASALGSGCLALPYAFKETGIGLGLVTLFAAGMVSAVSLQVLMVAARYTGSGTYAELMELAMGTQVISNVLDIIMMLNCLGSVICCLIFQGDFLPDILRAPPGGLEGWSCPREYAVIGAALAVWPLALPDDIAALRYVGIAVPIALLVVTLVVVIDMPAAHERSVAEGLQIEWWRFDNPLGVLKATAIFMNAYTNQMNAVQCADSFVRPSVRRIVKATVNQSLLVGTLYATLGIGGYMSYMSATQGDFLLNYPVGRPELWIIRCMLSVIVYVALPVSLLPASNSGAQLLFRIAGYGNVKISGFTHAVAATVSLAGCAFVALHTEDVATVLNIVGGILATPIMFFFPAIAFYQILWPVQPRIFRGPVLVAMLVFGVLGLASVLLNEVYMRL